MPEGLSWPELGAVLIWVVSATVFGVQKLKQAVAKHPKWWTYRVPWWVWLGASVILPFALVAIICTQWAQNLINPFLPESLQIHISYSAMLPTALSATIGANGSYAVAKKLGLTGDYKPGGVEWVDPKDVTPEPERANVPMQATVPEAGVTIEEVSSLHVPTPSTPAPPPASLPIVPSESYPRLRQVVGSSPPLYVVEYPRDYWASSS